MDGLKLLQEAQATGLEVRAEGDRLMVRGPRSQEAVARRLLEHKAAILAALKARPEPTSPQPSPAADQAKEFTPPKRGDVLTPWGWYSRLSEEDKRRWDERQQGRMNEDPAQAKNGDTTSEPAPFPNLPSASCQVCGHNLFWQNPSGQWVCDQCHPNPTGKGQKTKREDVEAGKDSGELVDKARAFLVHNQDTS